ncbi:MAG: hypothetical protein C5B49_10815 [Bdellovibrio sp.]|nr:MAG: hypothetical protein C5B49_10815 [Bdellovibrio sp.]
MKMIAFSIVSLAIMIDFFSPGFPTFGATPTTPAATAIPSVAATPVIPIPPIAQTIAQTFLTPVSLPPNPAEPAGAGGKLCHTGGDAVGYHCHEAKQRGSSQVNSCSSWRSPVHGPYRITDCIGSPRSSSSFKFGLRRHAGIDLANGQTSSTPIFAAGPGAIVAAGWMDGYGCVIFVQHNECPEAMKDYPQFARDKCVSFYAHLQVQGKLCPSVRRIGEQVNSCSKIGIMGGSGGSYPTHLHFEMRLRYQEDVRLNPLVVLGNVIRGASGNPNACQSTEKWLTASSRGFKTATVAKSADSNRLKRQVAAQQ